MALTLILVSGVDLEETDRRRCRGKCGWTLFEGERASTEHKAMTVGSFGVSHMRIRFAYERVVPVQSKTTDGGHQAMACFLFSVVTDGPARPATYGTTFPDSGTPGVEVKKNERDSEAAIAGERAAVPVVFERHLASGERGVGKRAVRGMDIDAREL